MEIYLECIKNSSTEIKEKLVNDILTLFQVRERQKEKDEMKDTWLLFIMDYKLTASEIYHAHKLALKREILDDKGNEIECLPMLSTNTTGKILNAYQKYKLNSKILEDGREKLKELLNPKKESTPEEKKQSFELMLHSQFEKLQKEGKVNASVIFYDLIKKEGLETIKLSFVENLFKTFNPQKTKNTLAIGKGNSEISLPINEVNDINLYFKDKLVESYFRKNNLKELGKEEFIAYWIKIYEKS